MTQPIRRIVFVACLAIILFTAHSALSYGPEGLFGGRSQPNSTVTLNNLLERSNRPNRAESVLERPRPDYDAVPLSLGSFDIYPSLETALSYDSNYFSTPNKSSDDSILNIRPTLYAASNWGRHALALTAYGDLSAQYDNDAQNFSSLVTELRGRYDIGSHTWLSGKAGYQRLKQPFNSPNAVTNNQKSVFDVYSAGLSAFHAPGILGVSTSYDFERLNYNRLNEVGSFNNSDQNNRNQQTVTTKLTYRLTENLKPFVRGGYNWRVYDTNNARNSTGYEVVAGAVADFGGITSLEAYGGWLAQDYRNSAHNQLNQAIKFGGRFEWNVTSLTSLVMEANRTIEETSLSNFNSYLVSGGSATLTHELRRNVLVEGNLALSRSDFQGTGSRQDDELQTGTGVRWLINRNLYSDVVYNWSRRESSIDTADFRKHVVSWRIGVQL
jgi:hypothetical protein